IHVLLGRQRHRTYDAGTRADDGLDDLARRCVDGLMVVGLKPDADLLSRHASPTLTPLEARVPGLVPPSAPIARPNLGPIERRAGYCAAVYLSWSTGPRGRVCHPYAAS